MFRRRLLLLLPLPLAVFACASTPPPVSPTSSSAPAVTAEPGSPEAAPALQDAIPTQVTPQAATPTAPPSPTPTGAITRATVVDGTSLSGQLSREEIKAVVLKNGDLFGACYSLGAGKSKQFVATVTVKATVGPTGVVNEALVTRSTAKNAKVDGCVADAFKRIKFPTPKDGATSVITFPIEFKGMEEVPGP